MMKHFAFVVALLGFASAAHAQEITSVQAAQAIGAGVACAKAAGINQAFAVVDDHGSLVAYLRMDGTLPAGLPGSLAKARASAGFRKDTLTLELGYAANPTEPMWAAQFPNPTGSVLFRQGGQPIGSLGALGVGGGTVTQDDACALAGVAAVQIGH
jgi:glc operon protein GlcG